MIRPMQTLKIPPPNLLQYPSIYSQHWMANVRPNTNNNTTTTTTNNNNNTTNTTYQTTRQNGDGRQQQRKVNSSPNRQNQNFSLGSSGRSKWLNNKPANYETNQFTSIPSLQKLRNDFLSGNMSKRFNKPEIQRRATVRNNPATYEIIVDIVDYDQSEIDIKVSNGVVIVSGNHNSNVRGRSSSRSPSRSPARTSQSQKNSDDKNKSEMRSFSERYSIPAHIDPNTLKWKFTGNRLVISAQKDNFPSVVNYRNRSMLSYLRELQNKKNEKESQEQEQ